MSEYIYHNGKIDKIEGDKIFVKITQKSACTACHAQSLCSVSEQKEKIIEVSDTSGQYHPGEDVIICGRTSLSLQAVVIAFVIPLIFMITAIIFGEIFKWQETTSALIAILLLTIYYGLLYLVRDKLKQKFTFTIKKI